MSRIGRLPIPIPKGVEVQVSPKNLVSVKGPKGTLTQQVDRDIKVSVGENIQVERPTDQPRHRALHGLYRMLIHNMLVGVSAGYRKDLELVGVGYRAMAQGQQLELSVGFSHPVVFVLPPDVKVTTVTEKGKSPTIILESIDKQLIGQVAAKIRSIRKPEPYKGKGIRFAGEAVRRKAGKTAAASSQS